MGATQVGPSTALCGIPGGWMQKGFLVYMELQSQAAQDGSCPPAAPHAFTLPWMSTFADGPEFFGGSQELSWQESR